MMNRTIFFICKLELFCIIFGLLRQLLHSFLAMNGARRRFSYKLPCRFVPHNDEVGGVFWLWIASLLTLLAMTEERYF
jgi:hypothetical protein